MDFGDSANGSVFFPQELVIHILDFVSVDESILKCRLVCKMWRDLIDKDLWRQKFKRKKPNTFPMLESSAEMKFLRQIPWFVLFKMYRGDLFDRNFVKNNCGQDGLKYWKAMHSDMGWLVEKCENNDEMPQTEDVGNNISYFRSIKSCFFLSQIVELPTHGLSGLILEKLTAKITVSIWIACVTAKGYYFALDVTIRNSEHKAMTSKTTITRGDSGDVLTWTEVSLVFDQWFYDAKYVEIIHGGYVIDGNMKITGAAVKLSIPDYHVSLVRKVPGANFTHTDRKHLTSIPWETFSDRKLYRPWKMFGLKSEYKPDISEKFPWFICRELVIHKPFSQNLLSLGSLFRNMFGNNDVFHNPLTFATNEKLLDGEWYLRFSNKMSKERGEKLPFFDLYQKIYLRKHGLSDCFMDNFQPRIIAYTDSFKYHSLGTNYELIIKLLDHNEQVLHQQYVSKIVEPTVPKPTVTFENYGEGVRNIIFNTKGYLNELRIGALKLCHVQLSMTSSSQRSNVDDENSGAKRRKQR